MILELNADITSEEAQKLASDNDAFVFRKEDKTFLVTSSSQKIVPEKLQSKTAHHWLFENDIQIASKSFQEEITKVSVNNSTIGDNTSTTLIAGPCSVESPEQINMVAEKLAIENLKYIRAGCYKPRTSPYSFQGLGLQGLKLLREAADSNGLNVVTEAKDSSHIDHIIQYSDVVQIGTKAMYDQSLLRACGESGKPVLLKRGFGSTLQEFVQAAEFILSAGNPNVILCERGIRTFENKTRFTLDLTGVAFLKEYINLPVVVDPSHAMGYAYGVPDLARAATAMGINGLLIEVHPNPAQALSDATQQLDFNTFFELKKSLERVANSVDRKII